MSTNDKALYAYIHISFLESTLHITTFAQLTRFHPLTNFRNKLLKWKNSNFYCFTKYKNTTKDSILIIMFMHTISQSHKIIYTIFMPLLLFTEKNQQVYKHS